MSITEPLAADTNVEERRSPFLVFVTVLANVYLYAFALDAILSIADDTFKLAINEHAISPLRNLVANLVVLGSLVMALVLLFVPHLPRRVFLPLVVFAIWAAIGAPPLTIPPPTWLSLTVALGQLILALFAFWLVRRQTDGDFWLSARLLPRKRFLVARTIAAMMLLFLFSTVGVAALGLAGFAAILEGQTEGYVDFTDQGVDLRERVLKKGNKTVHLIGMMHIGEPRFYITLFSSFRPDALVFAEGVTDKQHRLGGSFSYSQAAEAIGLAQQPMLAETLEGDGEVPDEEEAAPKTRPDVVRPDVDLSEFNEVTITFLKAVAAFYASRNFEEAIERFNATAAMSEDDLKIVMSDILEKRNARLLAEFDKRINQYDEIYIPWGAMHMPGIEAALLKRGFVVTSERQMQIVRYEVLLDALTKRLRASSAPKPASPNPSPETSPN